MPNVYQYIKYAIGIVLVAICFRCTIKHLFIVSFHYYAYNFIIGGISRIATITFDIYSEVIVIITLGFAITYYIFTHKKIEMYCGIEVYFNNEVIRLDGFVDTGAKLYAELKPIIILSSRYKPNLTPTGEVNLSLVNGVTSLKYYRCQKVIIENRRGKREIDCFLAFSDIPYDAIISHSLT